MTKMMCWVLWSGATWARVGVAIDNARANSERKPASLMKREIDKSVTSEKDLFDAFVF